MLPYRLDKFYKPDEVIEGYTSLIWTERYIDAGDFELRTSKINETMSLLPLGCCITLHDTKEVCIVEDYGIEADENGAYFLKVTGRSFETFLEQRTTLLTEQPIKSAIDDTNATEIKGITAPATAARMIDNARSDNIDNQSVIPNINGTITTEAQVGEGIVERFIARGDSYSEILKVLREENNGIRNVRPNADAPDMAVNIYQNWSRVTGLPDIVLDVDSGHFVGSVKYAWSIRDYKTAAYVASKNYFVKVYNPGAENFKGLDHRVGLIDYPDMTKTGDAVKAQLRAKGKSYLNAHKKTIIIDGTVSPDIPYQYNVHYGLGDNVKVRGQFGARDNMQVVEYIRSEDEDGESGYPTLI